MNEGSGSRLDFICSGIQKSGTTTLHQWLSETEGVDVPAMKEAPYFSTDEYDCANVESFLGALFGCQENVLLGKCTPQYMMYDGVAERLALHNPKIKIIVALRNPIDRLISHYKMNVRRGLEDRGIDEVVDAILKNPAKNSDPETFQIIRFGEYGRILADYRKYFPVDNFLLIDFDDFSSNSVGIYQRLVGFLGLPLRNDLPPSVGKVFHVGSTKTRFISSNRILKSKLFPVVKIAFPKEIRRVIRRHYDMWNIDLQRGEVIEMSEVTRKKLQNHFVADLKNFGQDGFLKEQNIGGEWFD